ncbi:ABC transporter ATP-binding protein [uncultured Ruminococcus sp.]|uniref:ABC transporter ATP-binding protein n=1 Tax=uncultured Ruminococcus sp. TaxID=165186 RepID=UPI0025FB699B|nr:ABC transporter ATP-binding protein [uncultured Ruminococcus sp.]
MMPGAAKGAGKSFRRLLSYMKKYWLQLILVLICILVSAVAGVAGSTFLQTLIDDYISPMLLNGSRDFSGLASALIKLGVLYAAGILGTLFYNRLMVVVAQGILKTIRDQMFSHMQTLPIRFFDTHASGDVMSLYTNDTDTLRQMLAQSVPQIFSSIVTVIAVFVAMVRLSIWLTLFVLVFVALMMLITKFVGGKSGAFFVKQQNSIGAVNGYIEEMIHGQKVIKVFCHEEQTKDGFDKHNDALFQNAAWANSFANILMPIMNNLGYVQYVLLAMLGGALAFHGVGGLTLGAIAAFLQLSRSFTMPISQISQQASAIVMALAGAGRIFDLLDEAPETDEGYVTLVDAEEKDGVLTETDHRTGIWAWKHPHADGTVTYTRMAGDVQFFDVDFGYVPEKIVLHDVSLYAKPGEKVAFVGATGAGKTTITNLINRFYDLADGKIRYDGININKIKKPDLRRSLGIVLQDVNLFTGTVMDNIRYGRLDATDEECIAAAKRANAHHFIMLLPDGYQTVLSGDGSGLSQGQRQLLSIARAAVADPPVMILDEATSSIDTRTERIVQAGMDALMHGRTVFVIAHRLSTIQNADVIMVLDHGRIIERGNHEKLMAEKGRYYLLYTGMQQNA